MGKDGNDVADRERTSEGGNRPKAGLTASGCLCEDGGSDLLHADACVCRREPLLSRWHAMEVSAANPFDPNGPVARQILDDTAPAVEELLALHRILVGVSVFVHRSHRRDLWRAAATACDLESLMEDEEWDLLAARLDADPDHSDPLAALLATIRRQVRAVVEERALFRCVLLSGLAEHYLEEMDACR